MQPTRVKICGITRPQDAAAAAAEGADEIGMILHAPSKRLISLEKAREIVKVVPPAVRVIGVFVDAEPALILDFARILNLAAVQLHGRETAAIFETLRPLPIRKAIGVVAARFGDDLLAAQRAFDPPPYHNLDALLFDTAGEGGSGKANDWDVVAQQLKHAPRALHWIAAGGLTPDNVAGVVRRLRPWAVDVSSGVEEKPGEKSAELIRRFIAAVRGADEVSC